MTNKKEIPQLTPEQKATIPKWRDLGIKIGLSTDDGENLTPELLREGIDAVYANAGLKAPRDILIFDSPLAGIVATCELLKAPSSVFNEMMAGDYIAGLDINFTNLSSLYTYLQEHKELVRDVLGNTAYGTQDIYWLAYHQFFESGVGLELNPSPTPLFNLSKNVGWWWPLDEAVVVTHKPTKIHLHDTRLHNLNAPAILYRDGFAVYAMNGVRFSGEEEIKFITTPADQINPEEVLGIRNVEQRSEVIKKVGMDRMFRFFKPTLLDSAPEHEYELYSLVVRTDQQDVPRKYLKMRNPSVDNEVHLEAVHPDCKTVDEALSWRNTGVIESAFEAPLVLT